MKWIGDRTEHFLGDSHGRDNITTARLALDEKGRFLALDLDIVADMGAYLSCYAPYIPWLGAGMATGRLRHSRLLMCALRAAYTNTVPVDAYRGAGRPEASYLIERAGRCGGARTRHGARRAAPQEIFIKPKAMPYKTPTGKIYDSGDFAGTWRARRSSPTGTAFSKRAAQSQSAGRLRGIGIATYIEACGNNGPETATLTLDRDGGVTVLIGTQSTGQGHATAYAQLVAEQLGPAARARARGAGRHRPHQDRQRHRRLELDSRRRRLGRPARPRSSPTDQEARRRCAGSRAGDLEIAERRGAGRRHRPRDLVRRSRRASDALRRQVARGGGVQRRTADLSERHAHRRGRDRSRHRRDADRAITSWSTISA